jgi:hypothetical protein
VLIGVLVLVPLSLGVGVLVRRRRWQRRVREHGRTELPALPPTARGAWRDRTPVS